MISRVAKDRCYGPNQGASKNRTKVRAPNEGVSVRLTAAHVHRDRAKDQNSIDRNMINSMITIGENARIELESGIDMVRDPKKPKIIVPTRENKVLTRQLSTAAARTIANNRKSENERMEGEGKGKSIDTGKTENGGN